MLFILSPQSLFFFSEQAYLLCYLGPLGFLEHNFAYVTHEIVIKYERTQNKTFRTSFYSIYAEEIWHLPSQLPNQCASAGWVFSNAS